MRPDGKAATLARATRPGSLDRTAERPAPSSAESFPIRIGAFHPDAWTGLVICPAPGQGFALAAARHPRDVLTAKGYEIRYGEYYGGQEHIAWAAVLPDALSFLLAPR